MKNPMSERINGKMEDRAGERPAPRPGERYRHFKNKLYQIVAVASHSETGEKMVVYQALYGDYGVWVRPLVMFLEPVDREKYPDAAQAYRFERVDDGCGYGEGASGSCAEVSGSCAEARADGIRTGENRSSEAVSDDSVRSVQNGPNPLLLEFLDCDSVEEKLAILQKMKGKVGQSELDSLCLCLDIRPTAGSLEEQLNGIRQYLRMQQRYDAPRLRRS